MKVLITSAGRRDYLVEYFQRTPGVDGVVAADASPLASALSVADIATVVPPFADPSYIPALLERVRSLGIELLLTVSDHDALVLAMHLDEFRAAGCLPLVPSARAVRLVMDKRWLAAYCRSLGIATPTAFASPSDALSAVAAGATAFPLVVKPRFGSASIGTYIVDDATELACAFEMSTREAAKVHVPNAGGTEQQVMVQEHISGPEFGIDVVNDPTGAHVGTLARAKLAMRGGETDKAMTVHDPVLSTLGQRLADGLRHVGCLDCDVIVRDGTPYVLDANPRIGGGYPFVHEAGADLPAAYVAWASGRLADGRCFEYEDGIIGSKSSRVLVNRPAPVEVAS